jgi:hypothetical protein
MAVILLLAFFGRHYTLEELMSKVVSTMLAIAVATATFGAMAQPAKKSTESVESSTVQTPSGKVEQKKSTSSTTATTAAPKAQSSTSTSTTTERKSDSDGKVETKAKTKVDVEKKQ